MSTFSLGHLSCREFEYKTQTILLLDKNGLRFTPFVPPSFPAEILGEIFIYCLEEMVYPDPKIAPLLLCNVCRRWREVALSTPRLWSCLVIDFDTIFARGIQAGLYQDWLSRARNTPLSLCLDDITYLKTPTPAINALIPIVMGLSDQWRDVDLRLAPSLTKLLFRNDGNFLPEIPLLERLSLWIHPLEVPQDSSVSLVFRDAPKLRHFVLHTYSSRIQIPWAQLHTFRCGKITGSSCMEVLRNSPGLLNATFDIYDGLPVVDSPVDHPRLQSLTLGLSRGGFLGGLHILDYLNTPALKSLALQFPPRCSNITSFPSFISRSSIQLHTLALFSPPTTTKGLIDCLKAARSVVHLKICPSDERDPDYLLPRLSQPGNLLPKLASLHIIIVPNTHNPHRVKPPVNPSVVARMLNWRWARAATRLQSFRLAYSHIPLLRGRMFGDVITSDPQVRRLTQEGMVVYAGISDGNDVFM
ncbi:hypothetical protein B0H16DRAFT_1366835 [Mycena metata]|uniref:F-box domain-containing protein n=1 Tax=Mycena metata TaxID=1033252 RepID=A0AAD7JKF9_9AGAR|nr:hypothetical protein B0H16DRAFT_1366835 [Mycena metata]